MLVGIAMAVLRCKQKLLELWSSPEVCTVCILG